MSNEIKAWLNTSGEVWSNTNFKQLQFQTVHEKLRAHFTISCNQYICDLAPVSSTKQRE